MESTERATLLEFTQWLVDNVDEQDSFWDSIAADDPETATEVVDRFLKSIGKD